MNIVRRLINAVDGVGSNTSVMSSQLSRIVDRNASGRDINGATFAPYLRERKDGRQVPIVAGPRLLGAAQVGAVPSLDGADLRISVSGKAATIIAWQNRRRRFMGFSDQDRADVKRDLMDSIRNSR